MLRAHTTTQAYRTQKSFSTLTFSTCSISGHDRSLVVQVPWQCRRLQVTSTLMSSL